MNSILLLQGTNSNLGRLGTPEYSDVFFALFESLWQKIQTNDVHQANEAAIDLVWFCVNTHIFNHSLLRERINAEITEDERAELDVAGTEQEPPSSSPPSQSLLAAAAAAPAPAPPPPPPDEDVEAPRPPSSFRRIWNAMHVTTATKILACRTEIVIMDFRVTSPAWPPEQPPLPARGPSPCTARSGAGRHSGSRRCRSR